MSNRFRLSYRNEGSNTDSTENRLIKRLRKRFPEIPPDISLREMLRGLTLGNWQSARKKILIILDQFEQRLSQADDYERSQLAKALRHCDGETLQCLLLIRDDFYLALTRFADALEMDLLEGKNSQAIDLFDREHAKKLLIKLGRAYGCLPKDDTVQLDEPKLEFVEQSVDQMATGNYVICVRLTLFAEMFKSRDWSITELKSVGGAQGVGQRFLQETFGGGSSSKRYQMQNDSAKAVLGALLPESGSDIRGAMKSESVLMRAANLENNSAKFNQLTKTLDQELRLITRTDPDESEAASDSSDRSSGSTSVQYQLTHDYLVSSVRGWLESDLKKTRRGRARLRLRELAANVRPQERPQNLPTNFEWLVWSFYFMGRRMSPQERIIMRYGRNRFLASFGWLAAIFALLSFAFIQDRNYRIGRSYAAELTGQKFGEALQNIEQLEPYRRTALPLLKKTFAVESGEKKRLATLGLYALEPDPSTRAQLEAQIMENVAQVDCDPIELQASVRTLKRSGYSKELANVLYTQLDNDEVVPKTRFRIAAALALLAEGSETGEIPTELFQQNAGLIGSVLTREPIIWHEHWIELFSRREVGESLLDEFEKIFRNTEEQSAAIALANGIYSFQRSFEAEARGRNFVRLLLDSNEVQFNAILTVFEQNSDDELRECLESISTKEAKKTAALAIALLRLGRRTTLNAS